MALAKNTKLLDEIRKWAEARGGKPAVVAATEGKDETGIMRLMFPDAPHHNDGALQEIGWDEFFEKFDASGLELTYQEKTAGGQQSDFNKLTYPDAESRDGEGLLKKSAVKSAAKSATKKSATKKSAAVKSAGKTAGKKIAATKTPATKTAAKKTAANKTATKQVAAKKSVAGKTVSKKTAGKSASKKSSPSTPARNYPKPDYNSPNRIF